MPTTALMLALVVLAGPPVPPELSRLEQVAEEVDDAVVSRDWSRTQSLIADGERALTAPSSAPASAVISAMKALADAKVAAHRRDPMATRRAANRLAAAVVEMYEPLRPTVPTSVMRLDVLLREVELAGAAGDLADARTAMGQVKAIWASISVVPPLKGTGAAHSFAEMLAGIERAIATGQARAIERSAGTALEGVDAMEAVFENAAR